MEKCINFLSLALNLLLLHHLSLYIGILHLLLTINGFQYYVIFVDHYTRFTWLYLLHNKSEVYSKFVHLHAMVKTQFSATIKALRSNGGGEYTSKLFESYLSSHGIHHQLSCPYTPQQNGLVERKHRHLIETTITLLS